VATDRSRRDLRWYFDALEAATANKEQRTKMMFPITKSLQDAMTP
jgi:hypothetical protein